MRTGSAAKGAKHYHWAMVEITPDDTPEGQDPGHGVPLLRRHRYTGTVSSFLCWSPRPVPLAKLVKVAVTRWRIEEDHQLPKQASGLDSGQVTTWTSWHRPPSACSAARSSPWPPPGSVPRTSARACST
jgi:SRSO17 transposase